MKLNNTQLTTKILNIYNQFCCKNYISKKSNIHNVLQKFHTILLKRNKSKDYSSGMLLTFLLIAYESHLREEKKREKLAYIHKLWSELYEFHKSNGGFCLDCPHCKSIPPAQHKKKIIKH